MRPPAPRGAIRDRAHHRLAVLGATAVLTAGLAPGAAVAQTTTWAPQIAVSPAGDLDPEGATITISGSGFDPAANTGTRPPFAGQPAGFYVVYGDFDAHWRPSEGAPSSARRSQDQRWVVPASSRSQVDPTSTNEQYVTLAEDGTFSFTLEIEPIAEPAGEVGIYTYPGSGAVNAAHELSVPITFAADGADDGDTDGDEDGDGGDDGDTDSGGGDDGDAGGDEDGDGSEQVDGPRTISDGYVGWGVKASFRSYIAGPIASGSVTTRDGATTSDDGTFRFSSATGTYDPGTGEVQASATGAGALEVDTLGTVRFQGHESDGEHLLDVTLSDPSVDIAGDAGLLSLDARSRGLDDPDQWYDETDVPFAELDLTGIEPVVTGDVLTLADVPATLTEEGAEAFAGFYEPGDDLDPVTLVLALDGAEFEDDAGAGGGTPATPGTTDDGGAGSGDDVTPAAAQLPATGTSFPAAGAIALLLLAIGATSLRRTGHVSG